jgi:hypothetical protein
LRFLPLFLVFSFIPMVDVHSVAASSHPSHREKEYERETTSQSRTGRLRRTGGRTYATTVMLESQPQCTTGTTASLSAVAGLDAALLATHQLLNNQLIVAAINSPQHERQRQPSAQQSRFPSAACVPSVTQAPPVLPSACPPAQHCASMTSYTMTNLREEINRH